MNSIAFFAINAITLIINITISMEKMRFILACHACTFELQQEPMRFVLARQAGMVELLFMFADQFSYVN